MTDRLDVTESGGLPNPADAGSGEALAAPFPGSAAHLHRPVEGRQGSARGPDLPRPGRGLRHPHRRPHRGDRGVPALARHPGAGAQRGELLPLQRELGHHRHVGDAVRHPRPAAGDRLRLGVRAAPGDAGGAGHRDLPDAVRAATGVGPAGLHGRPAGRGAVDHLRRLGPVRAGAGDQAVRDVAQREPRLAVPVLRPATRRWPAAARSSPQASCWR